VLGHVVLLAALWILVRPESLPKPQEVFYLTLDRPKPKPPEPVKPEIVPPPAPLPQIAEAPVLPPPKPVKKPAPAPAAHPPPADDGPPVHYFGAAPGSGTGAVASGLGGAGDGIARHAPSDYDGKVKARILANKVFPMAAQLKRQECVITYSITVDRTGHMIAHHIDPCLYPLVNEAAEATILKSGPFDPPENGAATRIVYGSLPYHLEISPPPGSARR
jgi:outer membrane biosynthesis protein TonB